jgi:hypothetical protein
MKFDLSKTVLQKPRLPEPLKAVMRKFSTPRDAAPLAFLPETDVTTEDLIERIKIPVNNALFVRRVTRKCAKMHSF